MCEYLIFRKYSKIVGHYLKIVLDNFIVAYSRIGNVTKGFVLG